MFINCPFDGDYVPLLHAAVFTVKDCGFIPRSALDNPNSNEVRIERIYALIGQCRLAIHDLSRTQMDTSTGLPRFNMAFELGIFLGASRFGTAKHRKKECLVLDSERYQYRTFLSDLAGHDIKAHQNLPSNVIRIIRDWLTQYSGEQLPSGPDINERYLDFQRYFQQICDAAHYSRDSIPYADFIAAADSWLHSNLWRSVDSE